MVTATRARRTTAILSLSTIAFLCSALPSSAKGVWDPNDTEGRLDIRWVGARYTSTGGMRLTVVLYPNFRRRALPEQERMFGPRHLSVFVDEAYSALFYRKSGRIRLSYGDHGSSCCEIAAVHRPNRSTLVASLDSPFPFGDEGDTGVPVSGESSYVVDEREQLDRTPRFRLPPPS